MSETAGTTAEPGVVPVCPRHPDRASYVRCQRCERPTCPECQRPAAVGVQCVDCVREGARDVRDARTAFGGSVRRGRPVVTLSVIGACVAVYLLQSLVPQLLTSLAFAPALAAGQPYRFLTAAFLHGGVLHIAFNMYALYLTGSYLEPLLGRARFAALYLVAAVGGSVGSLLLASPDGPLWMQDAWRTYSVGASGAVFGLFGAMLVVQRRLGHRFGQIVALIAVNGVIGFVVPGIAWQAHLGGLVTGLAVGAVMAHAPRGRRTAVQVGGTAAVVAVLVVASVLRLGAAAG